MKTSDTHSELIELYEDIETRHKEDRESEEENRIRHYSGSAEDLKKMIDDKAGIDTFPYRKVDYEHPTKKTKIDLNYPRQIFETEDPSNVALIITQKLKRLRDLDKEKFDELHESLEKFYLEKKDDFDNLYVTISWDEIVKETVVVMTPGVGSKFNRKFYDKIIEIVDKHYRVMEKKSEFTKRYLRIYFY